MLNNEKCSHLIISFYLIQIIIIIIIKKKNIIISYKELES